MTEYILGIGSNEQQQKHIQWAQDALSIRFPGVWFSSICRTKPIGFQKNGSFFLNRLAVIQTDLSITQLKSVLKQIEYEAGRMPQDKEQEIVRLDLDILSAGTEMLKAEELQRPYYRKLFQEYNKEKGMR